MALTGQGTKIYLNGAVLAEVNSIEGPGKSRETIETTTLDTLDGYRSFVTGFRNPGTLTLNMNFTYATYTLLNASFESNDPDDFDIILPDLSHFSFEGYVTELPISVPIGDKIAADITIQVTGKVTFRQASSTSDVSGSGY